jgi:hypothetical protein
VREANTTFLHHIIITAVEMFKSSMIFHSKSMFEGL